MRAFRIHVSDFLGEDPREWDVSEEEVAYTRHKREEEKDTLTDLIK